MPWNGPDGGLAAGNRLRAGGVGYLTIKERSSPHETHSHLLSGDGYWDRQHAWHEWRRDADRDAYRRAKEAEYHEWKHDRDKDMGWHERHF